MHGLLQRSAQNGSSLRKNKRSLARYFPASGGLQRYLGNQAIQAKYKVGSSHDRLERQADLIADRVVSSSSSLASELESEIDFSAVARRKQIDHATELSARPGNFTATLGQGQPLEAAVKHYMEPRFGQDFSRVRIHADRKAAQAAGLLHAKAFTMGQDIVFGQSEYKPGDTEGKRLLAHELAHVVQQQAGLAAPAVQKQEIPLELQTSVDHTLLTDEELQQRYDLIVATLLQFNTSTDETVLLEQEAGQIGIEVSRREAIAAGRTFTPESIERMRTFFIGNATSASPLNCIACMNRGLRTLLDDVSQAMGSEVQTTMARLQRDGRASAPHVIEFNNSAGRQTTGVTRPHVLQENVMDVMLQMAGNDVGWSVFGMSLMDGHHSVTLTLDNNDPANPRVFWSDQWSSKGGWMEFNRTTLNAEITRLIQNWWDGQPAGGKSRTRVTLWRLNQ